MQELLRSAANGWFAYTDAGKYAVLFLGVLLCYWYRKWNQPQGPLRTLMIYASVMAVGVICPLTAVVFMKYQTSFYDYKWVWSVVPVTLVIAYGAAWLYLEIYRRSLHGKLLKVVGLAAVGLAVIFLCGNLHTDGCHGTRTVEERTKTARLLDKLAESGNTDDICMWAPREILAHVRGQNGEIRLLYGRNMWEASLNAYAYDVYDQETIALYEWMEWLSAEDGVELNKEARSAAGVAIEAALDKGVNCIVIPAQLPEEVTEAISSCVTDVAEKVHLTVAHQEAEGYDIYRLRSK